MSRVERVRITVEFERPGAHGGNPHSLEECMALVMNQMRAEPQWYEPAGTGMLNYVCFDRTMQITSAAIVAPSDAA